MKNSKLILPSIAIVFATVGAFATNLTAALVPSQVVTNQATCNILGECSEEGTANCKTATNGVQLYRWQSATSCNVAAIGTYKAQ